MSRNGYLKFWSCKNGQCVCAIDIFAESGNFGDEQIQAGKFFWCKSGSCLLFVIGLKAAFFDHCRKNICLIYIVATIRKADGVRETPDRIAIFLNFQNDSQFLLIKVFLHENSQQICVKTLGTVASIEVNYSPPTMFIITLNFRTT